MKFVIITLFPEMFHGVINSSMLWKAQDKKLATFELVDLRAYGIGPRRQVDDSPYGGGDGMLMRPEPIFSSVEAMKQKYPDAKTILPTPRGQLWKQSLAVELSQAQDQTYIIFCPHYEGYDERVVTLFDYQLNIGNYILTGGEIPALAIIDSITRLIPGVLGGEQSAEIESFSDGDNLEFPQYTRPENFRGIKVPETLLSGHHSNIAKWRDEHSHRAE